MDSAPVLLVTGGSRGIGAAVVRMAVARGYDVCFSYVSQQAAADRLVDELRGARPGVRLLAVQADVADPADVARLFERTLQEFGRLDVMLNAASNIYHDTADEKFFPPELLQRMVTAGDLGRKTGKGFYSYGE